MAVNLHPNTILDFVVNEGYGVKGLADKGLTKVPERYIQAAHQRITSNNNVDAPAPQLPVIDLSGLDGPQHDEVVEALVKAVKGFGFCQVVNHGLSVEFLEELKDSAHHFFNQTVEEKKVYAAGASPSPSVTYGTSYAAGEEKALEWLDTLMMVYGNEKDDEEALTHWPEPCKELVLKYVKISTVLATRILQFLLANVGAKLDHSETDVYTADKVITMNFYPRCPEPDLTCGVGRHTDFGTITVLLQDEVGGLFVNIESDVKRDATWVEVEPVPGALIIMLGDMLEILSNGEYESPEHWVRTSSTKSRVSIPVFLSPTPTTKIRPLSEVADKHGGARYKESEYSEYLEHAYAHLGQAKAILNSLKIA